MRYQHESRQSTMKTETIWANFLHVNCYSAGKILDSFTFKDISRRKTISVAYSKNLQQRDIWKPNATIWSLFCICSVKAHIKSCHRPNFGAKNSICYRKRRFNSRFHAFNLITDLIHISYESKEIKKIMTWDGFILNVRLKNQITVRR